MVAIVSIFEELLTTAMFVVLSRCSVMHDTFQIMIDLVGYKTFDLWKDYIWILVHCDVLAT